MLVMNVAAQKVVVGFYSTNGNYWKPKTEKVYHTVVGRPQFSIRTDECRQTFKGWGTTFNELDYDAWSMLSESERSLFLKRVFNPKGDLRLTVGRIPVGASDYANDWYSCDETEGDTPDFQMEHFTISRDLQKVIPSIKLAQKECPEMTFWASPWSPPQWMKTNKHYAQRKTDTNGCPFDVPPYTNDQFVDDAAYYDAYCLYFDKFITAYREQGIPITALAYQNEAYSNTDYPGCSWRPETTGKFLARHLGPYMAEHQPELTLIIGTMNTGNYDVYEKILSTPDIGKYCRQIGFQWEGGRQIAAVGQNYPDYELVMTESECGSGTFDWSAAAHTFTLCNHYLANGVTTYTYWNTILRDLGFSSWGWRQNALVQVNSTGSMPRYCPEYYAYKHYTHFIAPGSKILASSEEQLFVSALAPDGNVVIVAGNDDVAEKTMTFDIDGEMLACVLPPKSFATYIVGSGEGIRDLLLSEVRSLLDIEGASLQPSQTDELQKAADSGSVEEMIEALQAKDNQGQIANANFSDGDEGWTVCNMGNGGDFRAAFVEGKTCYNSWSNDFTSMDIHQTVTGLPAGLYAVTAKSLCGEGNINDQHVYAETPKHHVTSPVKRDDVWSGDHWEQQTTATIYVAEGDALTVGYASTSGGGTKGWFCVTDFQLSRIGDLTDDFDLSANLKPDGLEEAGNAYGRVLKQARELAANEAFKESSRSELAAVIDRQQQIIDSIDDKTLIECLQRELEEQMAVFIEENKSTYIALSGDATSLLQSPSITADTNGGWLRDNCEAAGYSEKPAAIQSSVHNGYGISHWRGTAIADSKLIYQSVEGLPAGKYRLEGYAAATVWNGNAGGDNRRGVYLFANDSRTEVTSATYDLYSVEFELTEPTLILGLEAVGNEGNTWCFLSDVRLLYLSSATVIASTSVGQAGTDGGIFNLAGQKMNVVKEAGVYIRNRKKYIVPRP